MEFVSRRTSFNLFPITGERLSLVTTGRVLYPSIEPTTCVYMCLGGADPGCCLATWTHAVGWLLDVNHRT